MYQTKRNTCDLQSSSQELEESEARVAGEGLRFKFTRPAQGKLIDLEQEKGP